MKKILMAAVALTAMTATPALAADPSATFTVTGSVADTCNIGSGSTFNINSGAIAVDANGALSGTNTGTSSSVNVVCNSGGAQINIDHTPLVNTNSGLSDGNGFTRTIDFTPSGTLTNNGADTALAAGDNNTGIINGTLKVTAASLTTASNAKPFAGSYSGTIVVTVKAN